MEKIKKIDMHAHITLHPELDPPSMYTGYPFCSPEEMIEIYDKIGVEKGVLLPIVSPEGFPSPLSNEAAIIAANKYPDRFVWFCNVDPRALNNSASSNLTYLLDHYKKLGARGVGELTSNMPVDDPKMENLFSHVEASGLPILFHMSPAVGVSYGMVDDLGMPKLEKMLKKFPKLKVIGHSQPFWAEMSADLTAAQRHLYPTGKVTSPGRLVQLMRECDNLYCDLSAGSGANALTRDVDNAIAFLTEFQDRVFYGCDVCASCNTHQYDFRDFFDGLYESGKLDPIVYRKVSRDNAVKLLGL